MSQVWTWRFPVGFCHDGPCLGNGRMGVMVWGSGRTLRLTLGRADVWDHRGGLPWTEQMSYATIRRLLESGDEAGLRRLFEGPEVSDGPRRPTLLPLGRVEVTLPGELHSATLDLVEGAVRVRYGDGQLTLHLAPRDPVLRVGPVRGEVTFRGVPSATATTEAAGETDAARDWKRRGLPMPQRLERPDLSGWVQPLPADPAVCVGWRRDPADGATYVVVDRGHDASDAVAEAATLLSRAIAEGGERFERDARQWWAEYASALPKVSLPDPSLARLYGLGMYRFGGATHPRGVPCGLQGPWLEDHRMPPWSADYHFNINVQMCYSPAYAAGLSRHLRPLWSMLGSWVPLLRENAKKFVGVDDGLMLPHAVDDRCTNMGGFWSGTIDHGCTAWVARMMFDAWDHGLEDDGFLAEVAWPWLAGALSVYLAMSETLPDGTRVLPVTVSPEYRANQMDSWGRNASFQLAACHTLLDALSAAAERLERPVPPAWTQLRQTLPKACVGTVGGRRQILLWEGVALEESHRHHSHLAAISPFDVIDPLSEPWRDITDATLARWVDRGCGQWSGWCHAWASQLHARVDQPRAAVWMLEAFSRFFVSPGGGPYHNVLEPGYSCMGAGGLYRWDWQAMQLDGLLGSAAAVLDLLCHVRRAAGSTCHLFAGCPETWEDVAFDGIIVPGGFRVSATREQGRLTRLEVSASRDGVFNWACGAARGRQAMRGGETRRLV